MNSKSDFVCAFCSKILKDPINLPCYDTICGHHLKEPTVLKEKSIKCMVPECKRKFNLDTHTHEFGSNKFAQNLLEKEAYLSLDEKCLKKSLLESLQEFYLLSDEYRQKRNEFELESHEHFQEIRRRLDLHREKLKNKIDEFYLEMIEETKKCESSLESKLKSQSFDINAMNSVCQHENLKANIHKINEQFREVSVNVVSLGDERKKLNNQIVLIKSNLRDIRRIEKDLKEANKFIPNMGAINVKETLGSLYLIDFLSPYVFDTQILTYAQQFELVSLCQFNAKDKFTLLYSGSRDGFKAEDFHRQCDDKKPTLTIIKANVTSLIFGGYASNLWSKKRMPKSDEFIFSLTNFDIKPIKMPINQKKLQFIFDNLDEFGPIFGCNDICISNNADAAMSSRSDLGRSYSHPTYADGSIEAKSFLAGSEKFQVEEIEVYLKE